MRAPHLLAALLLATTLAPLALGSDAWSPGRNDYVIAMSAGHVIDATMWVPAGTPPGAELPGLIWIHGYGGSKDVSRARQAAEHGYVGFAYSTRGFGQSTGQMDVVGPGSLQDLKELIAWLKANGPVADDKVAVAGCSYGGGHSFQAAVRPDMGLAAAVPCASWTDLELALRPNDVFKLSYTTGFYATGNGLVQGGNQPLDLQVAGEQLGRRQLYDTYSPEVHIGYAALAAGIGGDAVEGFLRERSAALRVDDQRIPILLIQGLNDDLFAGDQVIDFFRRIPHAEKQLYLGYVGHPRGVQGGPEVRFIENYVFTWLDYYLKGIGPKPYDPAKPVWVARTPWDGSILELPDWTRERGAPLALNADGTLGAAGPAGVGALGNTALAGLPDDGAANTFVPALAGLPSGTPVDTLSFKTAPLAQATELLGTPFVDLELAATAGTSYQVAVKVFDVAPDGSAALVTRGIYGVPDNLPGPVTQRLLFDIQPYRYTFAADHRIEVRLASADVPAYMPERTPFALALNLGEGGSTIRLPLGPPS